MKNITILAYHRVFPEFRGGLAVTPEQFKQQLLAFKKKGFSFYTLKNVYEKFLSQNRSIPQKTIVITFDDGYKDNYEYAFPILKELCLPATIFLTVNYIGTAKKFHWDMSDPELKNITFTEQDNPLTWNQVLTMKEWGIEFGSHSLTHSKLTELSIDEAFQELVDSKKLLEEKIGEPVYSFCAPHGYLNKELTRKTKEAGYKLGVLNPPGIQGQDAALKEDLFSLRRIGVYQHDTIQRLLLKNSFLFLIYRFLRKNLGFLFLKKTQFFR